MNPLPEGQGLSRVPRPNDMDADYTPAFMKLARLLRNQIRAGDRVEGDRLPSAKTLAQQHGVSRATALHALEVLAANNYIARTGAAGRYRVTVPAVASSDEGTFHSP